MKTKRKFGTVVGVLLILLLASGTQAATSVFKPTGFMRGTQTNMFRYEITDSGLLKAMLSGIQFLVPFDVQALANFKGKEIIGDPLSDSKVFKFQADLGVFTTNVPEIAWSASGLGLSRLTDSDEPIPTSALLLLVGLIALIAIKSRRK